MSSTHAGRENKILGLAATALTHRRTQIHTQTFQFSKGKSIRDFFSPQSPDGEPVCGKRRVVFASVLKSQGDLLISPKPLLSISRSLPTHRRKVIWPERHTAPGPGVGSSPGGQPRLFLEVPDPLVEGQWGPAFPPTSPGAHLARCRQFPQPIEGSPIELLGVFSGRKYTGLSPPRTMIMDRSLYVTLSPTGAPRGDPQAHRAAGFTGLCYDMTDTWGIPRGQLQKRSRRSGGGTSQGWTSLRSDRGGERGQPRPAPPGAPASRLRCPFPGCQHGPRAGKKPSPFPVLSWCPRAPGRPAV